LNAGSDCDSRTLNGNDFQTRGAEVCIGRFSTTVMGKHEALMLYAPPSYVLPHHATKDVRINKREPPKLGSAEAMSPWGSWSGGVADP